MLPLSVTVPGAPTAGGHRVPATDTTPTAATADVRHFGPVRMTSEESLFNMNDERLAVRLAIVARCLREDFMLVL